MRHLCMFGQTGTVVAGAVKAPADTSALTALYRENLNGLIRMAVLLVGDEASAEDVVQDVFVRLQRSMPDLRDETKLLAYVRSAVLNGCRSVLRRRKLAFLRERAAPAAEIWSAESEAILGEDRREVLRALTRLPGRQREALVLRYYIDLADEEIAEAMGIRASTARSTLARALQALARELGEQR
ncbi:RNA polymerase sigma factor [Actinocorallia longicatena]|uniref:SigE family RNA polymerase sigma factor n=1 Tax=Actinocorallia longicatena TaxID=111803 RepID=A0ABP6QMR2_9ACTN